MAHNREVIPEGQYQCSNQGAISESLVSADLMRLGFHVYRPLNGAAPCDILAYRIGFPILRVEVKTTTENSYGAPMANGNGMYISEDKADHVAYVTLRGAIRYRPALPDHGPIGNMVDTVTHHGANRGYKTVTPLNKTGR